MSLHDKYTRAQNGEQEGTVYFFQKVFTSGKLVNKKAVTSRNYVGEESEDVSQNTSEPQVQINSV